MKSKLVIMAMALGLCPYFATASDAQVQTEIQQLQQQTKALQLQLDHLQKKLVKHHTSVPAAKKATTKATKASTDVKADAEKSSELKSASVTVHVLKNNPDAVEYNPVALLADGRVVTYIAGMPIVSSPYLGARPAFDGSDYLVNISSINRDIRLMEQRRRLYRSYERMGYSRPNLPIITLSGKVEPIGSWNQSTFGSPTGDWTLGSNELDVAAAINDKVEAYIALAYDETAPLVGGPRIANSAVNLNMGFVNIGDLDESPYYFTAGQLFVPFGRFSTAMVSAPLTMRVARTKARPIILGYKSQGSSGPFAAMYAFKSDTTLGNAAVGGLNLGYVFNVDDFFSSGSASGELGASFISSMNDAGGMQNTGSSFGTTFGGFASPTNGSEYVHKVPGAGVHGSVGFGRYSLTAEWVTSLGRFDEQDLSYNGLGAQIQTAQLEAGATFMLFDRPSSIGIGYQGTKDALALNLPEHRFNGVFNISIWRDTVESLEYRHDIDYQSNQFANGAAAPGGVNLNTIGTGGVSDTILAQIGVYF